MKPQAENLNQTIAENSANALEMLSERGRGVYFPYQGILGQSAAATAVKYNATIGIAKEEDNTPMRLQTLSELTSVLPPAKVFPYAPSFGNPDLRKTWKEMITKKNPKLQGKTFSLPVVTQALTHGLSLAGFLFLDPGDEILIPEPYWDNYGLLFEEALGAKVTEFPCFKDNERFDLEALEQTLDARSGKKSVLLLNFPNNPTGYTPTSSEMTAIKDILLKSAQKGSKLVVMTDDAYFGLVYEEGVAKESLFGDLTNLHENILAVKLDGATKEDYVWGFRVGFITFGGEGITEEGYKALADKAGGVIRGMISNCSQPGQSLLLQAYTADGYEAQKQEKYEILKKRYQIIKEQFAQRSEFSDMFEALPYNSGYFMCIRLKEGLDAEKVRLHLLEKYETGVIALGGLIRIAFSSMPSESIATVFDNIYNACKDLQSS